MARKITMQQIADRLGVSKYTVSQALAGKPGVSEATRREVTALAGALGYDLRAAGRDRQPSALSQERRQPSAEPADGKLLFIGLDERHVKEANFWSRVVEGLEAGCRKHGLTPRFFTFDQNPASHADLPELLGGADAAGRALGFIIAGNCPLGTLLPLSRLGLPMVLADHEAPLSGADAVLNANTDAGRMACHHLLSQSCGTLVFVGRDSFAVSFRERWWGCRLALDEAKEAAPGRPAAYAASAPNAALAPPIREQAALHASAAHSTPTPPPNAPAPNNASVPPNAPAPHQPPLPPQLKKWTIPYGAPTERTWQTALERRLGAAEAEGSLPQGFICANDDIALTLLQLLAAKGLRGIRVVGIDNTAAGLEAAMPLTTVDLAKEWLGIRAVEAFVRRRDQPGVQPEKIVLSARLVVRDSG